MNIAIKRILFPTDFSVPALQAQRYAVTLAQQFAAELHVLHVVENPALPVHGSRYSWAVPDDVAPRLIEKAELKLAMAFPQEVLATIDQPIVRAIEMGHPVKAIIDYATKHQVDLIVLATHGRSGLSHLLLGSVAEKLVRIATCPVLTVHPSDEKRNQ
jgi:nucleotide-binding universal stress UspA family protein